MGEEGYTTRADVASANPRYQWDLGAFYRRRVKTVLPSRASAKISLPIGPGPGSETIMDLLDARIRALCPLVVEMSIERSTGKACYHPFGTTRCPSRIEGD